MLVVAIVWLANVRLVLDKLTTGTAAPGDVPAFTPVPESRTVCGPCGALPTSDSVPVRFPSAIGVKVAFTVQLVPAINDVPQLLVWAKSPVTVTLVRDRLASPVLVSVIVTGELVELRA